MKSVVVLLLLLSVASPCFASFDAPYDGCCIDGYCYSSVDGSWWRGGVAYTRSKYYYYEPVYYCGRCYQKQYYWWKFYPVAVVPVAVVPSVPLTLYKRGDWRARLLDIASHRDLIEGRIRESSNEQNQFIQAVGALGLNFQWQNYGLAPALSPGSSPFFSLGSSSPGSVHLGNYGSNGNSIYGYTYSSVADVYGSNDTNVLYQQAAALAKNSQDLGGQATDRFSNLVDQAGTNRARVAEILAKAQAASTVLRSTDAAASSKTTTVITGSGETPGGGVQQPQPPYIRPGAPAQLPAAPGTPSQLPASIGQQKCAMCHNARDYMAKGGEFQIFDHDGRYLALRPQQISRIKRRVEGGQMPPPPNPHLTREEYAALLNELKAPPAPAPTPAPVPPPPVQ